MSYISLIDQGTICIYGPQAETFLQGQLTCDVREVTSEQTRLGALCNNKGRVLTTFRLWFVNNSYLMQLSRECIDLTLRVLQKYARFSKVILSDASDSWSYTGLIIDEKTPSVSHPLPDQPNKLEYSNILWISAITSTPKRCVLLSSTPNAFATPSSATSSLEEWKIADINAGIPTVTTSTSGEFTPHEINYPFIGGVSFKKGCYTGQEVVARMHYRGKLKKAMFHIKLNSQETYMPGQMITLVEHINLHVVAVQRINNSQIELLTVANHEAIQIAAERSLLKVVPLPYPLN